LHGTVSAVMVMSDKPKEEGLSSDGDYKLVQVASAHYTSWMVDGNRVIDTTGSLPDNYPGPTVFIKGSDWLCNELEDTCKWVDYPDHLDFSPGHLGVLATADSEYIMILEPTWNVWIYLPTSLYFPAWLAMRDSFDIVKWLQHWLLAKCIICGGWEHPSCSIISGVCNCELKEKYAAKDIWQDLDLSDAFSSWDKYVNDDLPDLQSISGKSNDNDEEDYCCNHMHNFQHCNNSKLSEDNQHRMQDWVYNLVNDFQSGDYLFPKTTVFCSTQVSMAKAKELPPNKISAIECNNAMPKDPAR
jgi:hypothetical protein